MFHLQLHAVELPQLCHTVLEVIPVLRVAYPDTGEVFCDLVTCLGVNVHRVVTQAFSAECLINPRFLPSVDEFVRPLARDAHNVLPTFYAKEEGPVGHALLQDGNVCDFLRSDIEHRADCFDSACLQVVGGSVQLPQLLVSVDFHRLPGRENPCRYRHPVVGVESLFPECACILPHLVQFSKAIFQFRCILAAEVSDADHSVSHFRRSLPD